MFRRALVSLAALLCFGILTQAPGSSAQAVKSHAANKGHAVLMISIDGMRPDYVLEADKHGLKIPVLRSLLKEGTYAQEVINVNPTITYVNHTTLVTGVWPAEHGIYNNALFDPYGKEQGAWHWYGSQVKAPTLWQAAKAHGLVTASVLWPVTVHSKGIDYNVPEYWRTKTEYDHYLLEAVSTPSGFLEEVEKAAGNFYSGASDITLDDRITRTSLEIIRRKKPGFMTIHIIALDHEEHGHGPFSPEANAALEQIDTMVGKLIAAERAAYPQADIMVVSDHGFLPISHRVNLNAALAQAGFVTVEGGAKPHVTDWKAFAWFADGCAPILLKDKSDKATEKALGEFLAKFKADPANGVEQVLTHDQAVAAGITSDAAFVVDWKKEYMMGNALKGPIAVDASPAGTHGYLTTHRELHSAFFMIGPQVAKGKNLGIVDMRQIAPTAARAMGIAFPSAKMAPLAVEAH